MSDYFEVHRMDGRYSYYAYDDDGNEYDYTDEEMIQAFLEDIVNQLEETPFLNDEKIKRVRLKLSEYIYYPSKYKWKGYYVMKSGKLFSSRSIHYRPCFQFSEEDKGKELFVPGIVTAQVQKKKGDSKKKSWTYQIDSYCRSFKHTIFSKPLKAENGVPCIISCKVKKKRTGEMDFTITNTYQLLKIEDATEIIARELSK